jgi:murein DD-endopeptidase MepM/ murein hydrolase activator NlpD
LASSRNGRWTGRFSGVRPVTTAGPLSGTRQPPSVAVHRGRKDAARSSGRARHRCNARPGGRQHEGIDIFAPKDTPVLSTTRGIVTRIGTNRLDGQVVWILGPGLERHYYAHLNRYGGFQPGDRVDAGAIIGYVGNTGNARGGPAHLHYGIYRRGAAQNPYPRFAAKTPSGPTRSL